MNKRFLSFTGFLVFFLACSLSSSSLSKRTYHYFPNKTILHGILRQQNHFGAPGFGETPKVDAKVTIYVIELDTPITVLPDLTDKDTPNSDPSHHVRLVQLFWDHDTEKLKPISLLGKHISVTGTLDEQIAPGQYTNVTMSVLSFHQD